MKTWTEELRAALRMILPKAAFLRRDRGGCFVTDAPRHGAKEATRRKLIAMGFDVTDDGELWCVAPGAKHYARFEKERAVPKGDLSRSLERFRGDAPDAEALALFGVGTRLLEASTPSERAAFDRAVRQYAARALRGDARGAFLPACFADELKR